MNLTEGRSEATGRALDVAIQGDGFLAVKEVGGTGRVGYTRNGYFFMNQLGELVVGMGDGYRLQPPIILPPTATNVSIGLDGTVQYKPASSATRQNGGQIKLTLFRNPEQLRAMGEGLWTATEASGPPATMQPGTGGAGEILSGYRESSNVNVTVESARLHSLDEWRAALLHAAGVQG